MLIRINGIVEDSIVDGPGLRLAVFTQGCHHACKGCHNPETHDPSGGKTMDTVDIAAMLMRNPLLAGITFSGGEPFLQPAPLKELADIAHATSKDVVTYTGFTFEQLLNMARQNPMIGELLEATDLLIDGPYVKELRDLNLLFRGSSNQRLLDRKSRADIAGAL